MKGFNKFDWLIIVSTVLMFTPTFYRLITLGWKSADYTHAYFILPISLWIIFQQRHNLVKSKGVTGSGLWALGFGLSLYLFGALNAFMFLEAFSFVLMMWAVFKLRFTKESFKKLLFPLAYLLFLVPPPSFAIDLITLPLKKVSTIGSYYFLSVLSLPVKVYGVILKVGENELFIGDACSGFRSIVTLLALGAVYAYVQKTSLMKKWIIFLSVIPLGILGNILRITITGCIAHFAGMNYAEGFFHGFSGVVLFAVTAVGLIVVGEKLCRERKRKDKG